MKQYVTIIAIMISNLLMSINSQNIENNTSIVGIDGVSFSGLSPQHLKFNVLRDRGAELEDFDIYSGLVPLNQQNYCTRDIFANLLRSVKSMSASTSWTAESILLEQDNLGGTSKASIAVLFYQYLYIKENALRDKLIKFENGVVSDNEINGVWQDPYATGYVLAFAPQDTVFENSVTFSFPKWIQNYGASKYEFDPGDGGGYRTVKSGSTLSVNYSNDGVHELKFRATASSGTHIAHSKIRTYTPNSSGLSRSGNSYSDIFTYENVSVQYEGSLIEGCLSRSKSGVGKQPFIYVEGFDIDILGNIGQLNNQHGYGIQGPMSLIKSEIDPQIITNFDFYYLDFKDGTCSNKAKAALLKKVITKINDSKTTNISNIIFGSSMGGLTARYCLTNMEKEGLSHQTSIMVCQDTPNLGANVPLGVLYTIQELIRIYNRNAGNNKNINDGLGYLQRIIHSEGAKELLYNYVNPSGVLDNSVHEAFLAEITELGYPKGDDGTMRCIAICNGNDYISSVSRPLLSVSGEASTTVLSDVLLPHLSSLFGFSIGLIFNNLKAAISSFMIGSTKLKASASIYPLGASQPLCDIRLTYIKKMLWLVDIPSTLYSFTKKQPNGVIPYDIVRGSYFDVKDYVEQFNTVQLDKEFLHLIKLNANVEIVDQVLFIPTASALDIGAGKQNLTHADYNNVITMGTRPLAPKHTPYHDFYIPSYSEKHIQFNPQSRKWLEEQLGTFVVGNPIGQSGNVYSLANNKHNQPIIWSTSDESIAKISQDGVLTAFKHGYIDVIATFPNGQSYPKHIMVGFPGYYLESVPQSNGYIISPRTNDGSNYNHFIKYITFQYSVVGSGSEPATWENSANGSHFIPSSERGEKKKVFVRACYINNDELITGNPVYIEICTATPYIIEPNYIKYFQGTFQNTITVKKNPYYTDEFLDDYKIYNVRNAGSATISRLNGVTSIVLSAEHIFPTSMRNNMANAGVTSITQSFELIGNRGNTIQTFNVSAIK